MGWFFITALIDRRHTGQLFLRLVCIRSEQQAMQNMWAQGISDTHLYITCMQMGHDNRSCISSFFKPSGVTRLSVLLRNKKEIDLSSPTRFAGNTQISSPVWSCFEFPFPITVPFTAVPLDERSLRKHSQTKASLLETESPCTRLPPSVALCRATISKCFIETRGSESVTPQSACRPTVITGSPSSAKLSANNCDQDTSALGAVAEFSDASARRGHFLGWLLVADGVRMTVASSFGRVKLTSSGGGVQRSRETSSPVS